MKSMMTVTLFTTLSWKQCIKETKMIMNDRFPKNWARTSIWRKRRDKRKQSPIRDYSCYGRSWNSEDLDKTFKAVSITR